MRSDYLNQLRTPDRQPPQRWQGGYWEHPPAPPAKPKKRPRRRCVLFAIALCLLLAGSITALALGSFHPSVPAIGGWGDGYDDPDADPLATAETTIRRAEFGGTFRLTLVEQPEAGQALTLTEIYEKNIPSIVDIVAMGKAAGSEGTGIALSSDGYILTNAHVIHGTKEASVTLQDGRTLEALLVGLDDESDLAVLKLDVEGLQPAEFGNSGSLKVGELAVAIGNPLGYEFRGTMTSGIISAINREVEMDNGTMTLIQTTAAINSGNSGGALINAYGQVVGITNMKMVSSEVTIEGLGFAIPTAEAKPIVDDIIAFGEARGEPVLGVTVKNSVTDVAGALVYRVDRSSDAYRQGLRVNDIITACNGVPVASIDDLLHAKEGLEIGDTLTLTVDRNGEILTFTVTLMSSKAL